MRLEYPAKVLLAWGEAISGHTGLRDWLMRNGYPELGIFTFALRNQREARQWLIDNDYVVSHEVLQGWWLDTGKKDPLLESNRRVLESLQARNDGEVDEASLIDGTVIIESGAKVTNSHIRGPVVIGKSVRIENSYIGPYTSVADECIIIDSEIDNSVVLDGARIEGVPRLVDSLIGRKSVVERSGLRPKATRLMIGDDCTVDLI